MPRSVHVARGLAGRWTSSARRGRDIQPMGIEGRAAPAASGASANDRSRASRTRIMLARDGIRLPFHR